MCVAFAGATDTNIAAHAVIYVQRALRRYYYLMINRPRADVQCDVTQQIQVYLNSVPKT
jgi:hypothetical protein